MRLSTCWRGAPLPELADEPFAQIELGRLEQIQLDALEDHTEGFRGSAEYERWRALLHHFYDPFPTVEHYETVTTA